MGLSDDLNLDVAWEKTKRNLTDNQKIFVNNPHIDNIIDRNKDEFLQSLKTSLDNGYSPSEARVISTPKKNWNTRPASILKIQDITVYSALVLYLYGDIKQEIEWSALNQRFSRILLDNINNSRWMENPYNTWKEYNEKTQEKLGDYEYVVITDINSYFENIDHRVLNSKVKRCCDNPDVRNLLRKCLRRWHRPKSRGLPQGYYPSNILSELYLNEIDKRLEYEEIHHMRYSDDLNMFCEDKESAINSLQLLIELYQKEGLYLNREKTKIITANEAADEFENPESIIKPIQRKIGRRIEHEREQKRKEIEKQDGTQRNSGGNVEKEIRLPYTDGGETDFSDLDDYEKEQILKEGFDRYVKNTESENGSLFRYLIKRMGFLNDQYAVPYCLARIEEGGPDITRIVDKYFSNLDNTEEIANSLMQMVLDGEIHYEFQKFVIIRWIFQTGANNDFIISGMRKMVKESHDLPEIKNYIIAYLGEYGKSTDIKMISNMYPSVDNTVQKSVILMAIRNMERSIRGSYYKQGSADHLYCEFAVRLAKEMT